MTLKAVPNSITFGSNGNAVAPIPGVTFWLQIKVATPGSTDMKLGVGTVISEYILG